MVNKKLKLMYFPHGAVDIYQIPIKNIFIKYQYPCFSHILGDNFFNQIAIMCDLKNEIYIPSCSRYFSFGHNLWETKFQNSYTVIPLRKLFALSS